MAFFGGRSDLPLKDDATSRFLPWLIAPTVYLDPYMMFGVLIYALAAATLGGIDNPLGAVIGGFIVGVVENLLGAFVVGNDLKLSVALVLIISVLLFRPTGLFGRRVVKRV